MELTNKLFEFIDGAPTAYHAIASIKATLVANGYTELSEGERWSLTGGGYFVTRGDSSIIAFKYHEGITGFNIVASHSDSPSFRIKHSGEKVGAYSRLDTERYGGAINYSWFDRPLGIAGRVSVSCPAGVKNALVDLDTTVVIPSVAPHLNQSVNSGFSPNAAQDLLPLYSLSTSGDALYSELAEKLGVEKSDILAYDLMLYNKMPSVTVGKDNELILAPRLDDLECAFASLTSFLASEDSTAVPVLAVFDNEEVGSSTREGAASTFLYDTLTRIIPNREDYLVAIANSFMVSADNSHGEHPAHPELSDPKNKSVLGGGISLKYNANHRYTTDGVSEAIFRTVAGRAGAKIQPYANRADMPGGSTLGSIASTKVAALSVDIGLPSLAMHSSMETVAVSDLADLVGALTLFYSTPIKKTADGYEL